MKQRLMFHRSLGLVFGVLIAIIAMQTVFLRSGRCRRQKSGGEWLAFHTDPLRYFPFDSRKESQ